MIFEIIVIAIATFWVFTACNRFNEAVAVVGISATIVIAVWCILFSMNNGSEENSTNDSAKDSTEDSTKKKDRSAVVKLIAKDFLFIFASLAEFCILIEVSLFDLCVAAVDQDVKCANAKIEIAKILCLDYDTETINEDIDVHYYISNYYDPALRRVWVNYKGDRVY